MMEKIKVVIADDHDIYRHGLKSVLEADEEITVIGEAADGKELIELVKELSPDVILTDLIMAETGGIEAIRTLYRSGIRRMIAISTFESEHLVAEAIQAGAMGYLIKNSDKGEPAAAIKAVFEYKRYYCKSTSGRLWRLMADSKFNPQVKGEPDLLSEKEKIIIRLLCEEKSNKEIAQILFMSIRTMEKWRGRIMEKLKVKTLAGVTIYAIRHSIYLIKPQEGGYKPESKGPELN
jgi:DNA-binding NarL/FixJ family response regulator